MFRGIVPGLKKDPERDQGGLPPLLLVKNPLQEEVSNEQVADSADKKRKLPLSSIEQAGSPYVYINLTELRGPTELKIRYVSRDKHEAIFETNPFCVTSQSPLDSVEMIIPVPALPRIPGIYALELLLGDEPLGSHRVTVKQVEQTR